MCTTSRTTSCTTTSWHVKMLWICLYAFDFVVTFVQLVVYLPQTFDLTWICRTTNAQPMEGSGMWTWADLAEWLADAVERRDYRPNHSLSCWCHCSRGTAGRSLRCGMSIYCTAVVVLLAAIEQRAAVFRLETVAVITRQSLTTWTLDKQLNG